VVEAKNSNTFMAKTWDRAQEDGIPMQYLIQIAKQVACVNCETGYCAVLIGGNEYRQYTYHRDFELEDMIMQADISFWDCVQMRVEPELTQISDCL
jgi:predicted phage-related endonuclease